MPQLPKLVNRGPAGLLKKLPGKQEQGEEAYQWSGKKNQIASVLKGLIVDIDSLKPDPLNARLHPERNMEAIKQSLDTYGQVKPIVVRKASRIIVAGNGTWEAAKALGWTKIAASIIDLTEGEAAGYGLADNRSAELAKWNFEVVARLDKMLQEERYHPIGWSLDELEVLRAADWTPPEVSEEAFGDNVKTVETECPSCGYKWSNS